MILRVTVIAVLPSAKLVIATGILVDTTLSVLNPTTAGLIIIVCAEYSITSLTRPLFIGGGSPTSLAASAVLAATLVYNLIQAGELVVMVRRA